MATGTTEFKALVDELEDLETRRTGSGGFADPVDAAPRQQVERRLIELIAADIPRDERRRHVRVPCDLAVQVRRDKDASPGHVVDVGAGGVLVETALPAQVGDTLEVELERRAGTLEHGLRVRGRVAWSADGRARQVGVAFTAKDDAAERRLRRFVIELLRKRVAG